MPIFTKARLARLFAACVLGFVCIFTTLPASAQSSEEAQKVLALISQATKAFEAGDFATAETKFADAYEIFPDPVLLYRVGLSAEKQQKYRVALESFEKFISAMPDDETAVKLTNRLPSLRAKVAPIVVVTSVPEGAEVRLDNGQGEILGTTPLETELAAGESTLYISLDGYEPTERQVSLEPAETKTVDARLVSQDVAGESESTSGLAIWGWTSVGVGAALLGTGAAFSVLTQNKVDEVNGYDKRAPNASPTDLQELKDQADSNYQNSLIAYVAGGAIATTGVVLLIIDATSDDGQESAIKLDAIVTPDRAWVGLRGNF